MTNASHAQHVKRASHANNVKVAATSAHGVSAMTSNAQRWILSSKILPWQTRRLWQRPWVAQRLMQDKKHRAASVASAVAVTTDVESRVKSVKTSVMQRQRSRRPAQT